MLGLLPSSLGEVTAFEYECYRAAEYAANTIEAEQVAEMEANQGNPQGREKFGGNVTVANNTPPTDDPFGEW